MVKRVDTVSLEEKVLEILKREPAGMGAKRIIELLRVKHPSEKHLRMRTYAILKKLEREGAVRSKRTHYVRFWKIVVE